MKGAHYHCPVNGWDCPHYRDTAVIEGSEEFCLCTIPGDPILECDDFYSMWGDCDPEDYTDYVDED